MYICCVLSKLHEYWLSVITIAYVLDVIKMLKYDTFCLTMIDTICLTWELIKMSFRTCKKLKKLNWNHFLFFIHCDQIQVEILNYQFNTEEHWIFQMFSSKFINLVFIFYWFLILFWFFWSVFLNVLLQFLKFMHLYTLLILNNNDLSNHRKLLSIQEY